MDCIKRSEPRLRVCARRREQSGIEFNQGKRLQSLLRALQKALDWKARFVRRRAPNRTRHFREYELTGQQLHVRDEESEIFALRLVEDHLEQRRSVRVEDRHASALAANLVE